LELVLEQLIDGTGLIIPQTVPSSSGRDTDRFSHILRTPPIKSEAKEIVTRRIRESFILGY